MNATALPLTMEIPKWGRLVFGIGENAAYAAAPKGELGPIAEVGRLKRIVVRGGLQQLAKGDPVVLEQMTRDLMQKLSEEA